MLGVRENDAHQRMPIKTYITVVTIHRCIHITRVPLCLVSWRAVAMRWELVDLGTLLASHAHKIPLPAARRTLVVRDHHSHQRWKYQYSISLALLRLGRRPIGVDLPSVNSFTRSIWDGM